MLFTRLSSYPFISFVAFYSPFNFNSMIIPLLTPAQLDADLSVCESNVVLHSGILHHPVSWKILKILHTIWIYNFDKISKIIIVLTIMTPSDLLFILRT